jgi:hypothetical protein
MPVLVTQRRLYRQTQMTFGEYLQLPGFSHSTIKALSRKELLVETDKMKFGTKVHNYLLEPHKYEHESDEVKKIAIKLKERIGPLFEYLEPELAVQASFSINGFVMPYKGRIDLGIPGKIVVDLKIINGATVRDTIDFLGYKNSTSGYALGLKTENILLAAYSRKTGLVELINLPFTTRWWEEQIVTHGTSV